MFSFHYSRTIKMGHRVCSRVPKMRFSVRSRRDSKMRVLAQTTTFWPLLSRANAVDEN